MIKKRKIDELFKGYENMPGVVVLAAFGPQIAYYESFGMSDLEHSVALQKDSVFDIASISKPITAAAILMLCERKLLNLEDEVAKYMPELESLKGIQIKHLLNHTSGIENYYDTLRRLHRSCVGFGNKEFYELIREKALLNFGPGEEFEYSNSGYVLLSLIIEKVTGRSYEHFMRDCIFKPFGMNSTYVYSEETTEVLGTANGYSKENGVFHRDNISTYTLGDGAIFSTVEDLHAFICSIMWEGITEKITSENNISENAIRKVIPSKSLWQDMISTDVDKSGRNINYGYGWEIGELNGEKFVYHSGLDAGYRCLLSVFPKDNLIIVLLSNNSTIDFSRRKTLAVEIATILREGI